MTPARQLTLALGHEESLTRDNFLVGPANAAALALVDGWPEWPAHAIVLVGPEGCGKSHLAAIWAAEAGARLISAHALDKPAVTPALVTGALVIENVGQFCDEVALFHLLNLAREQRANVLLTTRLLPAAWNIDLPDLASRVRALPVARMMAPDDTLLRAVLVKLFNDRQLAVDENLIGYLATRIERSFAGARAAVDRLDREALRQLRPVTRALASELFRD